MWTQCGGKVDGKQIVGCTDQEVGHCQDDLTWADLSGAKLTEVVYDDDTKFPEHFDPEAAGMVLVE